MAGTPFNYLTNLARLPLNRRILRPLVIVYTLTAQCNLNCAYCEDFGARRNAAHPAPLPLADARRLLRILRQATDALLLTGGEPLLYPDLPALLAHARRELRFRHITLLTNATLLAEHWDVLPAIDRLMISLDATAPETWGRTLGGPAGTAQRILANIRAAAARQSADRFRLALNCVVTPETLPQIESVLDFCIEIGALFSFSPQSFNNWPRYELLVSDEYRAFIRRMVARKRQGAPMLASGAYLKMLHNFEPYACYPMLAPRVLPDGGLAYPCRPIEREGDAPDGRGAHGGRDVNVLTCGSWDAAVRQAIARYGDPPATCGSCFQQCYIEPSLLQTRPLTLLGEVLRYPSVRQGRLWTYAPG